jgi:hypothetical protein
MRRSETQSYLALQLEFASLQQVNAQSKMALLQVRSYAELSQDR